MEVQLLTNKCGIRGTPMHATRQAWLLRLEALWKWRTFAGTQILLVDALQTGCMVAENDLE